MLKKDYASNRSINQVEGGAAVHRETCMLNRCCVRDRSMRISAAKMASHRYQSPPPSRSEGNAAGATAALA
eukprot:6177214-Pleurochrysis_carterae.AAC.5